jgi:alkyl sulfatase BDS1-like metallo-beta-lactamase superfamily hydrolase
MMKRLPLIISVLTIGCFLASGVYANATSQNVKHAEDHYHPKGKAPSEHTIKILEAAKAELPFSDKRDFEEADRGFIAAPDYKKIMADAGNVAWSFEDFDFISEQEEYSTIHPSLMRQTKLTTKTGLFEVLPDKIYQVRNFDLSNITFVRGKSGWIVFDPCISVETARAAKELVDKHLGEYRVSTVVFSHNHGDHFGGVRGLVDEEDVKAGKVEIIAPVDFMEEAISENVYAGAAMSRRAYYQYGQVLARSPYGYIGQGLGQGISIGFMSLIEPTTYIKGDIENYTVDGIKMVFQNTPGAEAPAEMNTFIPEWKALWMAENVTGVLHNIYTLRGAPVRDALQWSKYINESLHLFGFEAEVMFASHHWPRWGNERILEVMKGQRDLYANLNNQSLHHANQGVTVDEMHNVYETPKSISDQWYNRGYHGSPEHNSRGVVDFYIGYWDNNPATLIPLPEKETAPLFVEMMGGAKPIINKGVELFNSGDYLLAVEILNKLLFAQPQNQEGKDLLADCYEQIGYQQENPGLRNSFLNGAYELRSGISQETAQSSMSPDLAKAMSTGLFFEFIGIMVDSKKAEGMEFTINLITPENGEKYIIEMSNATLTNIEGYQAKDADLTLTISRMGLAMAMTGKKTLKDQITDGDAKAEGNVDVLTQLASTLVHFSPDFEILPGTKTTAKEMDSEDFEVDFYENSHE